MVKFGHLYRLKLKGAHFSQLLRQRSIFWKSWDCLSYNCMQVYPDILACKYIRVHFLRFQSLQNTKYPLILACNTKWGNWVPKHWFSKSFRYNFFYRIEKYYDYAILSILEKLFKTSFSQFIQLSCFLTFKK